MALQVFVYPAEECLALPDFFFGKTSIEDLCHPGGDGGVILSEISCFVRQSKQGFPAVALVRNAADQAGAFHAVDHAGKGRSGKGGPVGKIPKGNMLLLPQNIQDSALCAVEGIDSLFGEDALKDPITQAFDL